MLSMRLSDIVNYCCLVHSVVTWGVEYMFRIIVSVYVILRADCVVSVLSLPWRRGRCL